MLLGCCRYRWVVFDVFGLLPMLLDSREQAGNGVAYYIPSVQMCATSLSLGFLCRCAWRFCVVAWLNSTIHVDRAAHRPYYWYGHHEYGSDGWNSNKNGTGIQLDTPKRVRSGVKRVPMAVDGRFPPYENIYWFLLNLTWYQVSKNGLHELWRRLEDRKAEYTEKIEWVWISGP